MIVKSQKNPLRHMNKRRCFDQRLGLTGTSHGCYDQIAFFINDELQNAFLVNRWWMIINFIIKVIFNEVRQYRWYYLLIGGQAGVNFTVAWYTRIRRILPSY